MLAEPRRHPKAQAPSPLPEPPEKAPRKRGGRPKGPPSTILNLRIPLDLLERLDRYLDHLDLLRASRAHNPPSRVKETWCDSMTAPRMVMISLTGASVGIVAICAKHAFSTAAFLMKMKPVIPTRNGELTHRSNGRMASMTSRVECVYEKS